MKSKKIQINFIFCFAAVLLFVFNSCNAPRNNPLDPANPDYSISSIEGTVREDSYPYNIIKNVNVLWENELVSVETNSAGYYILENLKRNDGWLIFSNEHYNKDSIYVSWKGRKKVTANVALNARPVLDSLQLYSIIMNKYQFNQDSKLFTAAQISDADGGNDIDSVFISNPQIEFNSSLDYNPLTHFYEKTFSLSDLNVPSLDVLIGQNFKILVRDLQGRKIDVGTGSLKRVIKDEIEIISPINNDTVSQAFQPIILKWKRLLPGFQFTYLAQIYTNDTPPELVWEQNSIPSDSISTVITQYIQPGEYFWVIWSVDNFLDRNRSKPATFVVE